MPLHLHQPRPTLNAFIRVMCLSEDYRPEHELERILPDGSMTLVVRLDADELRVYEPNGTQHFSSSKGPLIFGVQSTFPESGHHFHRQPCCLGGFDT